MSSRVFFFVALQGALVGSYKGRCHLYNTSGTGQSLSSPSLCLHFPWPVPHFRFLLPLMMECKMFTENKLQQKSQINLQNKKKKSHHKKITGFQVFYWPHPFYFCCNVNIYPLRHPSRLPFFLLFMVHFF